MSKHPHAPNMKIGTKVRWYLVASRTDAVIYEDNADEKFAFVERMSNDQGDLRPSELDSDKPGRGVSSGGGGTVHHALERKTSRHDQVARKFAQRIAKTLEAGTRERRVDDVIIAAEPRFLGILRAELSSSVQQIIRHEIHHDYLHKSDDELRELILHSIQKE